MATTTTTASTAPALPRRPDDSLLAADNPSEEPPPPYEPVPSSSGEQTLQYGPLRPFQEAPPVLPPAQATYAAPSHPPPPRRLDSQYTGQSNAWSPPPQQQSNLPPPSFPFWNGANLTPAQTGYRESYIPQQQFSSPTGPYSPPPLPPRQATSPAGSTSPAPPAGYKPQETATPGQPLLHEGKLLVYPPGKETCWKCSNTGFKPFDPYTGYRGDDPNHPCKNCWKKYGKPYTSAMRIALENPTSPPPPNYQRPLRLSQTPSSRPTPPNVIGTTSRMPWVPLNPNTIVVRPGDPRIGGVLCRRCGGSGTQMGIFIFDEDTCEMCNGAGRVFV
ncbi:hypothetical protein JCM10908_004691 [Rhodotorula pacifica]|uniref:uncharacterized protein n=1 Tax=Rhodotorula pacifica TaxID=1495444 RepID=UPI00316DD766